jgi:phosphoglycerate kinase
MEGERPLQYLNDLKIKNKKVLIRVDMNVPLDKNQNITDDNRIRAVLPTLNYALDENAKVILCSHIGRPKGKVVPELSLAPVARRLSRLLQKEVKLAPDCVGPEVKKMIEAMRPGDIVLLENLRFHPEETKNDDDLGRQLASLADIYVNDAFAVAHRAHASVVAVAKFAQEVAAGFLMKDELKFFHQSLESPARPLVAVIGGSKVSGKLEALENLLEHVDKMVIGGAMANTFLKGVNYYVGQSLVEEDLVSVANCLMRKAKEKEVKLYIPVDCVVAPNMDPQAETKITPIQEVPRDWMILDIGPATSMLYAEVLQNAKTIIWNGPMGAFEMDAFSRGTMAMVQAVANSYALTIVGGGDTDVAVHKAGETSKISYISTGGGAFLALLEGSQLPGVAALDGRFALEPQERPDSCIPKSFG